MRKLFASLIQNNLKENPNLFLLTADLGFGLFNDFKLNFPRQYYNVGAAEQLLIGSGIGLANEGKIAVCYSITPFLLCRPYEFIRNYIDYENTPVKLVGAGRDKDYSHDGISHWAEDDETILSNFKNIQVYKPKTDKDLIECFPEFLLNKKPSYLNLKR